MKKIIFILLALCYLPSAGGLKRSLSSDNVCCLDKQDTYYQDIYAALRKINPQAMMLTNKPNELLLSVALELNELFLIPTKLHNPHISFFLAATQLKYTKDDIMPLLKACFLDPINTLKTHSVVFAYLQKTLN